MRHHLKLLPALILVLILLAILPASIFAQVCEEVPFLLKTSWGGTTLFNKYNPGNHSPGCHSMALAQILYYHKMQPAGTKHYITSKGDTIRENFSGHTFNWDLFVNQLNEDAPEETVDEMALYLYYIAAALEKNFGTGSYQKMFHKKQIKQHFSCRVKERAGYKTFLLGRRKIRKLLVNEIDKHRPVYFHYTDFDGGGHSIVIDAYRWKNKELEVHANYGWGGKKNGWYTYEKDCFLENTKVELLILIRPSLTESSI